MQQASLTLAAPAKLNLFLHITGRRSDGYHNLQTVFQFLDYADELEFTRRDDGGIVLCDTLPDVPAESDLVHRAAVLLQQLVPSEFGVSIKRLKRLPIGGGLGGGSSNAATTLVALNQLWALGLSQQELLQAGLTLGADVPIFVHGSASWAESVGEQFSEIDLPEPWFTVLVPPVNVSTAKVFSSQQLTRNCSPITIRDFLAGSGRNVFEPVVRAQHPIVAETLDWLTSRAVYRPAMSGTGSCVFVRCENQREALNLIQEKPSSIGGFAARGQNRSLLYERASPDVKPVV